LGLYHSFVEEINAGQNYSGDYYLQDEAVHVVEIFGELLEFVCLLIEILRKFTQMHRKLLI
jgi:hypothetical protein